jgi:ribosomal protein S12 methylthiotransferase accessory factor
MDLRVFFPGGKKVYLDYKGFTIQTDQPERDGGENSAPSPFDLFLASIAACAGYYVLAFCQSRGIDTAGIELIQRSQFNRETHLIDRVDIIVRVPDTFPEKYHAAVIASASQCSVKKHLQNPPRIEISVER